MRASWFLGAMILCAAAAVAQPPAGEAAARDKVLATLAAIRR